MKRGLPFFNYGINSNYFNLKSQKTTKMKKLILIFAISAFFVACNDAETTTETETPAATEEVMPPATTDSMVVVPTDSMPAPVDAETPAQ